MHAVIIVKYQAGYKYQLFAENQIAWQSQKG